MDAFWQDRQNAVLGFLHESENTTFVYTISVPSDFDI